MYFNVILGLIFIALTPIKNNILLAILGVLWIITPYIMYKISIIDEETSKVKELSEKEKEYVKQISEKTWQFFKDYLTEENNYLIPDNEQEDRKPKVVPRTSSTNIGLSLLAVISSYDLKFESLKNTIELLSKIINVIYELPKWNGHLYNWYNIKTKTPLIPRYISTVDSGNLLGYMYTTRAFL